MSAHKINRDDLMPREYKDLPNLTFLEEVIKQFDTLKYYPSLRERLYSFLKRLNHFGIHNYQLLGGEELTSTKDREIRIFQIKKNEDYIEISIRLNSDNYQIVKLEKV